MKKILGLDMGVASIGWSLIEYNQDDEGNIIDSGVRIFDQNLQRDNEAQKGESKNNVLYTEGCEDKETGKEGGKEDFTIH